VNNEKRVFITDCEGPISKNDNAFEIASHFIPEGQRLFTQISRYDDVLADVVKREGHEAGDTLRLIAPFLKAYGVTNKDLERFSARTLLLMPGAKETLRYLQRKMPSFIVSTSYEHYVRTLCHTLNFPYENCYCTSMNLDTAQMNKEEQERLTQFRREICSAPLIEIPEGASSAQEMSARDRQLVERLDAIFREEVAAMESGAILKETKPVGGREKARAAEDIVKRTESSLNNVIYFGDSITDVECFRLVRAKNGVTVSVNGNIYAVREAEIAVLATNVLIVAAITDIFEKHGKEGVHSLIDRWGEESLEKYDINPGLRKQLQTTFPKTLPRICKVTSHNLKPLAQASSSLRKFLRGEKVGGLG
jgi:energy-converting hydrogenase A subunit R